MDGEVGVACQYDEGDCVPASGAGACFKMVADVADVIEADDEQCGVNNATQSCEADAKCSFITEYDDQGQAQQPHCSLVTPSPPPWTGCRRRSRIPVSTRSRELLRHGRGSKGCHILQGGRRVGGLQVGNTPTGFSCAGNAFAVTDAAHCLCANVSASSIGSFATLKDVSASNACFDAPLVNVVVEQNACYRAPKWFSDRASPASGVARAGNFDPSTAWRAFDAFDEDDTSVDDVIADVPETLGHVLLDDATFDVGVDSWAHGSVVAQILADSVLSAYKNGGPRAWAPKSPSSSRARRPQHHRGPVHARRRGSHPVVPRDVQSR